MPLSRRTGPNPSDSRRKDRGTPQGTKGGTDPRNGGRHPQKRTGANPRAGFQVPCAVFLNIDRHLKLSEVAPSHNRRRLMPNAYRRYFSTWTSSVTSLLHVYGSVPSPVAESVASITVVNLTCPVLRRADFLCHLRGVPCLRGGARLEEQKLATRFDNTIGCHILIGVGFFSVWMFYDDGSPLVIEDCLSTALWKIFSARATIHVAGLAYRYFTRYFFTQAGSSCCRRSPSDMLDFPYEFILRVFVDGAPLDLYDRLLSGFPSTCFVFELTM